MNSLTIRSPAKVNLFLKITGKRKDGYHTLVTLFHRISLSDTITLKKIPSGIKIKTNTKNLPTGPGNLVWNAFWTIQKTQPFKGGVHVTIKKRIPIGGGMGGGSSNAASFTLGLKRLYNLKIPKAKLYKIGSKLGADVNFFLTDVNQAFGYGTGDQIKPVPYKGKLWFVIVSMPKPLLTAEVYRSLDLKRLLAARVDWLTNKNEIAKLLTGQRYPSQANAVSGFIHNDLQDACIKLYPAVKKVIELFDQIGAVKTLVSGSGPTVISVCKTESEAKRIAAIIKKKSRTHKAIFIARTI